MTATCCACGCITVATPIDAAVAAIVGVGVNGAAVAAAIGAVGIKGAVGAADTGAVGVNGAVAIRVTVEVAVAGTVDGAAGFAAVRISKV